MQVSRETEPIMRSPRNSTWSLCKITHKHNNTFATLNNHGSCVDCLQNGGIKREAAWGGCNMGESLLLHYLIAHWLCPTFTFPATLKRLPLHQLLLAMYHYLNMSNCEQASTAEMASLHGKHCAALWHGSLANSFLFGSRNEAGWGAPDHIDKPLRVLNWGRAFRTFTTWD